MRVLVIGQLPREEGGTYTTGIARVVENLYLIEAPKGLEIYWYFTNVPHKVAKSKNTYDNQYNGFQKMPFKIVLNCFCNPIRTCREWRHYKVVDETNPLRYEFYKTNFRTVIDRVKPDLIHLHGAGISPLYYANRDTKIPIVITFHGVMYNENDSLSWHFKPSYSATMRMADFFTVLNQETKRKALLLGMPEDRCTIIPNGVDTEHFYFSEYHRNIIRNDFKATKQTFVFLTTGVIINRKGQFDFLRVLEGLGIDYQYWIIGKGPDEEKISDYIDSHHLKDKVKLLGYIEGKELFKYLSAADFYAHVSTTEGQALSEIEAYATGLSIIVRKEIEQTVVGNPEDEMQTYFVLDFENNSNEAMISWLTRQRETRISRDRYDWRLVAKQYYCLYKELGKKNN